MISRCDGKYREGHSGVMNNIEYVEDMEYRKGIKRKKNCDRNIEKYTEEGIQA